MKKFLKAIAVLLAIVFTIQVIPAGAVDIIGTAANIAAPEEKIESTDAQDSIASQKKEADQVSPIVNEEVEWREENVKHFRYANGLFTASAYAGPVHYEENGEWKDIDNSLSLDSQKRSAAGKATYTPVASGLDIRLPQEFADEQKLTISKDGFTVGLGVSARNDQVQLARAASIVEMDELPSENINIERSEARDRAKMEKENALGPISVRQQVENANERITSLDKLSSAVVYPDIFPGADLEYILTPSKIKENIVIKQPQAEYIYHFDLSLGGLIPVPQEDGSIYLFKSIKDAEPLFILESPYMYDAADEISAELKMELGEDGVLTLTASEDWINDEARVWPVVLDPTLVLVKNNIIQDAYVSTNAKIINYNNLQTLYAGVSKSVFGHNIVRRTYIKFTLPTLPDGSILTHAFLNLFQQSCEPYSSLGGVGDEYLYLYDLTGKASWAHNTVTWNNQPLSKDENGPLNDGTKILDYQRIRTSSSDSYKFGISQAVRNWYANSNSNNGVMLTTRNETKLSQPILVSAEGSYGFKPAVEIFYTSQVGLEDYWTYDTVDLGRSGTAFINDHNGSLTYTHNDLAMSGNRLPINISHVNAMNAHNLTGTFRSMKVGVGFQLNILEQFVSLSIDEINQFSDYEQTLYAYKLIDSDGTPHYFKRSDIYNSMEYVYEYDDSLTMQIDPGSQGKILTDAQGNKKYYQYDGIRTSYLYKIEDCKGNVQTIHWSGNRITHVTDGADRVAVFGYDGSNRLTSITDPAGRSTIYGYNPSDQLTSITYPDGNSTLFQYSSGRISRIDAYDGSYTTFVYEPSHYAGVRMKKVTQHDKSGLNNEVGFLDFSYVSEETGEPAVTTKVTDKNGNYVRYLFDELGHVANSSNQDNQTQFEVRNSSYSSYGGNNTIHKLESSSELQTVITNLLKNHGFEYNDTYWSLSPTAAVSSAYSSRGQSAMSMTNASTACWEHVLQGFSGEPGKVYTLSADFYIPSPLQGDGGAVLGLTYSDTSSGWHHELSEPIKSTDGWERHSFTFEYPGDAADGYLAVITQMNASGTFYFDNVQLELSGGARHYNLVENSDFSNVSNTAPVGWQLGGGALVKAKNGRNEVHMPVPMETSYRTLTQTVQVNAKAGETIVIGGKARSTAPYHRNPVYVNEFGQLSMRIKGYASNGSQIWSDQEDFELLFTPDYQIIAASYKLPQACAYLTIEFALFQTPAEAYIADAFVYVGSYGTHYSYNGLYTDSGLLNSVRNDNNEEIGIQYYANHDIKKIEQKQNGAVTDSVDITYSSDGKHNVTKTVDKNGVETHYDYTPQGGTTNTYGMATGVTVKLNNEVMSSESMVYTPNYNYLLSHIDTRGGISSYTYNTAKGLMTSFTDPKGNTVSYEYHNLTDELVSTTGNADPLTPVTTSFGVDQNYLLQTIDHNSMEYSYEYDDQNRVLEAKVGALNPISLVTNTYDSRQRLASQTFANGAVFQPMYDSRDRLVGEKWDSVQTTAYLYNENDRLSWEEDKITGISQQYIYDFTGRLERISRSDGLKTKLSYDEKSALSRLTVSQNDVILSDASYTYHDDGRPDEAELHSFNDGGAATLSYSYDGLTRPTRKDFTHSVTSINPRTNLPVTNTRVFSSSVTYTPGLNGTTTGLVSKYKNEYANYTTYTTQEFDYSYDANGNIESITTPANGRTTTYEYDGLNRLVLETNYAGDKKGYIYDEGGNIIAETAEAGVYPGFTFVNKTYSYDDPDWTDRLTEMNSMPVLYDEDTGNITRLGDGAGGTGFIQFDLSWNNKNQLTRYEGNASHFNANLYHMRDADVEYEYNARGELIKKIDYKTSTAYGQPTIETEYIWANGLLVQLNCQWPSTGGFVTDSMRFVYDAGGGLVGFKYTNYAGTTDYIYQRNAQGDIVAIAEINNTAAVTYTYDSWGRASYSGSFSTPSPTAAISWTPSAACTGSKPAGTAPI
ncbi:MAG: DNRLRE domain-containing protein [Oscillospiraceae bacterium]|nr:DNRLRE domain-containing protein [Oscillospiraceae bacterium]